MIGKENISLWIHQINILNEIHHSLYFKWDYINLIELLNFYSAVFNSMVTKKPKVTFCLQKLGPNGFKAIHQATSDLPFFLLFLFIVYSPLLVKYIYPFHLFNLNPQLKLSKNYYLSLELPTLNTLASSLHPFRKLLKFHMFILSHGFSKLIDGKVIHFLPTSV